MINFVIYIIKKILIKNYMSNDFKYTFYLIILTIRLICRTPNFHYFFIRFLYFEYGIETVWDVIDIIKLSIKLKKADFQKKWKECVTPRIDRLGVFLNDNLKKYDAPQLLQKIVSYIFLARKFFFWFVVISIVVGFVFSWQWTYLMYFTAYIFLKFEDQLLDLLL